jgi:ABC-type sulfate/molybdate transport systems ATPase subunit
MLEVSRLSVGAIGPVSFSIAGGECVVLSGASGSGKSRILRAVADLDPNEGNVRLGTVRRDLTSAPDWRRLVGYLPSESGWWTDRVGPHFPAGDKAGLLPALGLSPEALSWSVLRLSTGEKQRLAFARLLANDPQALLLDEPTSALDEQNTALAEAVMRERLGLGGAILLVSHDRSQTDRMADRRLVLEDGRLVEAGP